MNSMTHVWFWRKYRPIPLQGDLDLHAVLDQENDT